MPKTLMCDPELLQKDLSGRVYIVTGANSGAGLATSAQLARQGAHVVGGCRRVDAGREAFAELAGVRGSAEVMELDLASFASIRRFAEAFITKHDRLDGLVNNAGVMACPEGKTEDGFETQFGVNYLGHFLLTELLLETLKLSAPSRIVCLSSVVHIGTRNQVGDIQLDDPNFEKRPYDRQLAYTQSKLAMVLHALDLSRRLRGTGVSAFSVHPGWVRTNLAQHMVPVWVQNVVMRPFSGLLGMMSAYEGAQTTLHCLLDDDAPQHSGEYYSQMSILYREREDRPGGWPMKSPNPNAHDAKLAEELYHRSLELVGLEAKR
jgi:NAD(P)-dependent dehydrogenase (short-subunit alcohol dehydrogenase family)